MTDIEIVNMIVERYHDGAKGRRILAHAIDRIASTIETPEEVNHLAAIIGGGFEDHAEISPRVMLAMMIACESGMITMGSNGEIAIMGIFDSMPDLFAELANAGLGGCVQCDSPADAMSKLAALADGDDETKH
jgi:hypothetical protein